MSSTAFDSDSVRGPPSSSNQDEAAPFPKKSSGLKDIAWEYGKLPKPDSYSEV